MEDLLQPSPSRDLVDHAGTSTQTIPSDLIFEILSLLPPKSLIRLQSVSKQWFSIIRSKDFVDSFLTRSKTRPRVLLILESYLSGGRFSFFFSIHEVHNNNDDDKSTTVIARHDMKLHALYYDDRSFIPVNGFICFRTVSAYSKSIFVRNPTTRQIVKLPDVRTKGSEMHVHLGYDPVQDEYKVLCVIMMFERQEYFVCTVRSSQKQEWRMIENTTGDNYQKVYQGICIDGAIYYGVGQSKIIKFDVRYEKLEIIKVPKETNISNTILIDYKGKLCVVDYDYAYKQDMRLWILEDAEKQEWSTKTWAFPSRGFGLKIKGVTHTGAELILVDDRWFDSCKPYFVYYYDLNKESTRKVEIHGLDEGLKDSNFRRSMFEDVRGRMFSCPGYVDNIRFL